MLFVVRTTHPVRTCEIRRMNSFPPRMPHVAKSLGTIFCTALDSATPPRPARTAPPHITRHAKREDGGEGGSIISSHDGEVQGD